MNHQYMFSPRLIKVPNDYSIPIFKIFIESYRRTKGMKKAFWISYLLILLAMILPAAFIAFLNIILNTMYPLHLRVNLNGFFRIFFYLVVDVGLSFLALQHIRNHFVKFKMGLEVYEVWKPLAFFGLIPYFLSLIYSFYCKYISTFNFNGTLYDFEIIVEFILLLIVLIIISMYIFQLIIMTMLLVLDRDLKVMESFILCFKSINKHFLKKIGLGLFTGISCIFLTIVTLGIGLIWLKPMIVTTNAIQYQHIFGSLFNSN